MEIEGEAKAIIILKYGEEFKIGSIIIKYESWYGQSSTQTSPPLRIEVSIKESVNPSKRKETP